MLGHMSALLVKDPKSVLVVGFGAGVTAGAFVTHPGIKRIVICEIEPLIPEVVSTYFTRENHDVTHDPRVQIVYDDARHYILTTKEKFDVITSDPIHPWVKGAATLYTKEYFDLVKQHLNPGGVVTQWVPLYESLPDVVKSELATFFDVFPDGTVWSNDIQGKGYDVVLSGHASPQQIDLDSIQRELAQPEYAAAAQSLGEVGFGSAMALFATYGGQARLEAVARGRADQSRLEPPIAVSGRHGAQHVREREHLRRDAQVPPVPRGSVRGERGREAVPARGDRRVPRRPVTRAHPA
jgi:spermidine synthase